MQCRRSLTSVFRVGLAIAFLILCGAAMSVTLAAPPAEVTNVLWCGGSSNCVQWSPVAGATQYRVHRGEWASLPCVVNPALESCDRGAYTTTSTGTTILEAPAPGSCFWFVVTAVNGSGEGTPGFATPGPREVDTTGACAMTCAPSGAACAGAGDCCSSLCISGTCLAACCQPPAGACSVGSQCCSGVCSGGLCQGPCTPAGGLCSTNTECCSALCSGGTCQGVCTTTGGACTSSSQCCSNLCTGGLCQATCAATGSACSLGAQCCSGQCSGGTCVAACTPSGGACATNSQCCSSVCSFGTCQLPSCMDGVKNGSETGVDCGGGVCPPCANGQPCNLNSDCASNACAGGVCQAASCMDGVKNGAETDVDCGGGVCAPCALGKMCAAGSDCVSGLCQFGVCTTLVCSPGYADCNNNPGDGCEVNTATNVNNCGACANVCPALPNATRTCVNSQCGIGACDPGYANCDQVNANGCEVYVAGDPTNCSSCGAVCSTNHIPSPTCSGGTCNGVCSPGYADCNNNRQTDGCEVNTAGDPNNCGFCGYVCTLPNATATCTGGACGIGACSVGYANCDANPANGCEVYVAGDPANCGSCGTVCSSNHIPAPTCGGGACNGACSPGYADCNNNKQADGCETSTTSDTGNCGACGHVCGAVPNATPSCAASACTPVCNAGYANCDGSYANGCEVNLNTSNSNCGTCGHVCPPLTYCLNGGCYSP